MKQTHPLLTLFLKVLKTLAAIGAFIYIIFPFAWLTISSFKPPVQLFSRPPEIWPSPFVLSSYFEVMQDASFVGSLKNSAIVATFTTAFSLTLSSLGAYAFARLRFKGKQALFLLILASQMLPFIAILIPLFIIMRSLGLMDTYLGLVLSYSTFTVPYIIWLLQAFFKSIPVELEDAGMVDGCTRLGVIWRIIMPLSAPGLAATGIFAFIGGWNHYIFATILTESATRTFPLRLAQFITEERVVYEMMYPAGVIGSLPVILLVLFFQKYIVKGITEGGVKF